MKHLARIACLALVLLTQPARAIVIYDWVTTSYTASAGSTFSLSDLYDIDASWTLADAAVERGSIQLIGYDSAAPYPFGDEYFTHPEEIIDFSFTANSLDGSRNYAFDKYDTHIDFTPARPTSEAYDVNMRIGSGGPVADVILTSPDNLAKFYLYTSTDTGVLLGNGSYFINGHWQRREQIPEPAPLSLLAAGLLGFALTRRYAPK